MSLAELEKVQRYLKEFLEKVWIRPSTSLYSAPILFVRKANGSLRMCIDYRVLNKQTSKYNYPIPTIDDLLDRLLTVRYFNKLDLSQGYHQVVITPGHEHKTALISRYGLFELIALSIGLFYAPSTCWRLMNNVFRADLDRFVLVYLDDILVYSPMIDKHVAHLRTVLEKLRGNKLYVKRKKYTFGVTHVGYLGCVVGNGKVQADQDKVSTVTEWPVPESVKHVQQFMGFANYYNRYILHFATLSMPLTDLLQKHIAFHWGDAQQRAFDAIKTALTSTSVLALPDPSFPYQIVTDASAYRVGATLQQDGRSFAYFSRKLNPAERNYSVHDRELLAIFLSCKRWKCYVHRNMTTVLTDREPLVNIFIQPALNSRQACWVEQLSELDLKIQHVPGVINAAADALSRRPYPKTDLHSFASGEVQQRVADWLVHVAPYVTVQQCIDASIIALKSDILLKPVRCEMCKMLTLSVGKYKSKKTSHAHVF